MGVPRPVPVLVVTLLTTLLAASCSDGAVRTADPSPSAAPAPGSAAPAGSTDPPGPSTAAPVTTRATALYWLGAVDEPRGPRLYREFVPLPVAGNAVRDAVQAMFDREPGDPDHVSLWAEGTSVRGVRREGSTAVVDLTEQARTTGGGSAFEAMTVQQLVHTATAADPSVTAVRLEVGGRTVETLWGAVAVDEPLRRAPTYEVLGPVWIDAAEGEVVDRVVRGTATVFEATVSWDIRRDGRVVQEGFSTATEGGPGRGAWTAEIDVPAGDYELRAWESSAKDGSVTWLETRRVHVR